MTQAPAPHHARRIAVQRLLLFWEALWPRLQHPLMAAGLIYVALASAALFMLPAPFRLAALVLLAVGLLWSLRALRGLTYPSAQAAMARLETHSRLSHQPLQSLADRPAGEAPDNPLWTEHLKRQHARLGPLPLAWPRSAWRVFDPLALRVPVVLAVIATAVLGPGLSSASLSALLRPAASAATAEAALEAWVTPPAYTGKPPFLLTRRGETPPAADRTTIIPAGSLLSVRLAGARAPTLRFITDTGSEEAPADLKTTLTQGLFSASGKIARPLTVVLEDGGERAHWRLDILPDQAPAISLEPPAQVEPLGALGLAFAASDDYGLAGITADLSLADQQNDGPGFAGNGIFLFEPPDFPVKLSKPGSRTEKATAVNDLTSHPWAGFRVTVTLTARDGAGQETTSPPLTLDLPERPFSKLMARALIEQRRRLILDDGAAADVATMLRAFLTYPVGQFDHSGDAIMLAAIASRLANVETTEDVKGAVKDLWSLALALEEGRLAEPRAALEAARRALEQALADGAPPEKIKALTQQLRDAMQRYLKAMGEAGGKNPPPGQNGKMVTDQDLQKMLDDIEKLSRNGATDQARQLLSQLDQIMRNLKPTDGSDNGEAMQQLNELTDILRQQQKLMDETQRQSQRDAEGNSEENGTPQGQPRDGQGQDGMGSGGPSLSEQQKDLGDRTGQLGRKLGPGGPGELGEAEGHMKEAGKSLAEGDSETAGEAQGKAMEALRKALSGMAQQMLQQGQGAGTAGRDPLGRDRDGNGRNPATNLKLPSQQAIERARQLLELLRQRSADPSLTPVERDYIDRLLRGLY